MLENFFKNSPEWLASWTGIRIDSGDLEKNAELSINWWKQKGEDLKNKLLIFSDGLDTEKIIHLHKRFSSEIQVGFGWGTLLTNDFRGLSTNSALDPFSIVCKATSANGKATVKLSDNINKSMGPNGEIQKYKKIFELKSQTKNKLIV